MSSSEQLMGDLAARNPVHDADIRATTVEDRRSMAHAWTGASHVAAPTGVRARAPIAPFRAQRGRQLLVAAAVTALMAGTAVVTSGLTDLGMVQVAGPVEPAPDPLVGADLTGISDAQAADIEDRVATKEEYDAAYQRHQQCLSSAGFEIREVPLVAADGTHDFTTPGDAVESGADDECYQREYRWTNVLFQSTPAVQDHPSRTQSLQDCLRERDIHPRDTSAELDRQLRDAGIEPSDCWS